MHTCNETNTQTLGWATASSANGSSSDRPGSQWGSQCRKLSVQSVWRTHVWCQELKYKAALSLMLDPKWSLLSALKIKIKAHKKLIQKRLFTGQKIIFCQHISSSRQQTNGCFNYFSEICSIHSSHWIIINHSFSPLPNTWIMGKEILPKCLKFKKWITQQYTYDLCFHQDLWLLKHLVDLQCWPTVQSCFWSHDLSWPSS